MNAVIADEEKDMVPPSSQDGWPVWLDPVATLTQNMTAMPLVGGNVAHLIGVHVELFVSEIGDQSMVWHAQRSYYETLLRAGVKVLRYPAPFILHAKHFSVDDDVALIGSSNMDMRSFGLNSEISLMVRSKSSVAEMRAVERGYRDISKELTLQEWQREPRGATVLDGLSRLTSALQ